MHLRKRWRTHHLRRLTFYEIIWCNLPSEKQEIKQFNTPPRERQKPTQKPAQQQILVVMAEILNKQESLAQSFFLLFFFCFFFFVCDNIYGGGEVRYQSAVQDKFARGK